MASSAKPAGEAGEPKKRKYKHRVAIAMSKPVTKLYCEQLKINIPSNGHKKVHVDGAANRLGWTVQHFHSVFDDFRKLYAGRDQELVDFYKVNKLKSHVWDKIEILQKMEKATGLGASAKKAPEPKKRRANPRASADSDGESVAKKRRENPRVAPVSSSVSEGKTPSADIDGESVRQKRRTNRSASAPVIATKRQPLRAMGKDETYVQFDSSSESEEEAPSYSRAEGTKIADVSKKRDMYRYMCDKCNICSLIVRYVVR